MKKNVHDRIEAIAGAIALGEASDEERREYRQHISSCTVCLSALGGEHEIERVAATVGAARDEEVWQPEMGDVVLNRTRRRSNSYRWGFGLFAMALAASFGAHGILAAGVPQLKTASPNTAANANAGITRVTLEQHAAPSKQIAVAALSQRRLVVMHNVVQIARAPLAAPAVVNPQAKMQSTPEPIVAMTVHAITPPAQRSNVPEWRRDDNAWHTVARTTTTSVTETAPQSLTHSAESLQVASYPSRDVAPVGGETAINPQPPMIAYDEGAQGTTVFEVLVDERGTPTKCIITRSAGYPVLDDAVCRAAMKARYTPKIVDGRAVPGAYQDAFTFHMSESPSAGEGIPNVIPGTVQRPGTPGTPF